MPSVAKHNSQACPVWIITNIEIYKLEIRLKYQIESTYHDSFTTFLQHFCEKNSFGKKYETFSACFDALMQVVCMEPAKKHNPINGCHLPTGFLQLIARAVAKRISGGGGGNIPFCRQHLSRSKLIFFPKIVGDIS